MTGQYHAAKLSNAVAKLSDAVSKLSDVLAKFEMQPCVGFHHISYVVKFKANIVNVVTSFRETFLPRP